jgi:hypothetical protein
MTALELITSALRVLGIVAEGEAPSNESAEDALASLNLLFDSWGLSGIVHGTITRSVAWPSGTGSLSLGPTGDVVGVRPTSVRRSSYYNDGDTDDELTLISEGEYHALALKDLAGPPHSLWINYTYPDAILSIYPVPTENVTLYLTSEENFDQATDLAQVIAVPPGVGRALKYELAVELAPEYGVDPSPTVRSRAWQATRWVKRTNMKNRGDNQLAIPGELSKASKGSILEG